jgi:hypothetical protein
MSHVEHFQQVLHPFNVKVDSHVSVTLHLLPVDSALSAPSLVNHARVMSVQFILHLNVLIQQTFVFQENVLLSMVVSLVISVMFLRLAMPISHVIKVHAEIPH